MIALLRTGFLRLRRTEWMRWRVMIVGAGRKAKRLCSLVEKEAGGDLTVVGFYPVTAEGHDSHSALLRDHFFEFISL